MSCGEQAKNRQTFIVMAILYYTYKILVMYHLLSYWANVHLHITIQ